MRSVTPCPATDDGCCDLRLRHRGRQHVGRSGVASSRARTTELLSTYAFKQYRDTLPAQPTPLPWAAEGNKSKEGVADVAALPLRSSGKRGCLYRGRPPGMRRQRSEVMRSSTPPTTDHAYTQFVAYEYYDKNNQKPLSEQALQRAANGPEPSWEVYSRLIDIHMARNDYVGAQTIMNQAVVRFENSPVLLPKRIQICRNRATSPAPTRFCPSARATTSRSWTTPARSRRAKARAGGDLYSIAVQNIVVCRFVSDMAPPFTFFTSLVAPCGEVEARCASGGGHGADSPAPTRNAFASLQHFDLPTRGGEDALVHNEVGASFSFTRNRGDLGEMWFRLLLFKGRRAVLISMPKSEVSCGS